MRYVGDHGPLSREDAWRHLAIDLSDTGHFGAMACGRLRSSEAAPLSVVWAFIIPKHGQIPSSLGPSLGLIGPGLRV